MEILLSLLLAPIILVFFILFPQIVLEGLGAILGGLTRLFTRDGSQEDHYEEHHIPKDGRTWDSYGEYMGSDTWAAKRKAVLNRADNRCEIEECNREAEEVHHEEYPSRWGQEPLHNLKAVCGPCHDDLHPDKPNRHLSAEDHKEKLRELGVDV